MAGGVSLLKFVGTVSLGLLTGVSASVSAFSLPTLRRLSSSATASQALTHLTSLLHLPLLALSSLSAAPLFLALVLSPRHSRHPYLLYTSALAVLSAVGPACLELQQKQQNQQQQQQQNTSRIGKAPRQRMDASYEVLGDVHSEGGDADEDEQEEANGEEVEQVFAAVGRANAVRTTLAAAAFFMSVLGLWGDGAPRIVVRA